MSITGIAGMVIVESVEELTLESILPDGALIQIVSQNRVGSRVTCNPAPTDTDDDRLVLVHQLQPFVGAAMAVGFACGGSPIFNGTENEFASLKLNELNIIATADSGLYRRFIAASSVAKRLNLLKKNDRIALFQAVLYGNGSL